MTERDPDEPDGALRLEVTAQQSWEATLIERTAPVLREPDVMRNFPDADHWLVGWDVSEKNAGRPFTAIIQDGTSGRATLVDGSLDDPADTAITYLPHQRPPSDDEFAWAVSTLAEANPGEALEAYRPFPPLANVRNADGVVRRAVAVGLRAADGTHRVVGVEAGTGDVVAGPPLAERLRAGAGEFGAPPATGPEPTATGAHQARVQVWRDAELLWDFVAVRPSASSGMNGSGLELRSVDFAGARVLERAGVPIVTVATTGPDPASCEVERVWMHEEGGFDADAGSVADPAEGFRICAVEPATVADTGTDGGSFRGVALWLDGRDLVLVSQLRAGWHRFVQEWRLCADGTIRSRFGYAPARQPGAEATSVVTAHWRLDVDILGPDDNTVQEHNDPPVFGKGPWHTIRYEMRRPCEPAHNRYWRFRNDKSSRAYSLFPGAAGEAVWILRHHPAEVDDGQGSADGPARAPARLDDFVSGEPVHREDIVLWCSAVIRRQPGEAGSQSEGPHLVPRLWKVAVPLADPELLDASLDASAGPTAAGPDA